MKLIINRNITKTLEQLILEAEKIFVIISPFIIINDSNEWKFVNLLKEKSDKGLFIEIHTRKKYKENGQLKEWTKEKLNETFGGIFIDNVYFHENLHAKLYFNENTALVTSLNLLDKNMKNNIEIGYILKNREYKKILKYFYEKHLVKPILMIKDKLIILENELNEKYYKKYFEVKYNQNKIFIINEKFTLECYLEQWQDRSDYQNTEQMFELAIASGYDPEMGDLKLEPHNQYLLKFLICLNEINSYHKVDKIFYDIICKYCLPINYKNNDNEMTILFSSDFVSENRNEIFMNKPINLVLHYSDIRNVFYSIELHNIFKKYVKHIIITLSNILYKK